MNTKIFARSSIGVNQILVYSMEYDSAVEMSMILPLPAPLSLPEDALHFIDLSTYPDFFADMQNGFPVTRGSAMQAQSLGLNAHLKVHEVGSFEASFVPALKDFDQLDEKFKLPDAAWSQLPRYADYSFAVFKLRSGAKTIHPMAFEFPRRNPLELFFPTIHIHHGVVEERADFDHTLFCQSAFPFSDRSSLRLAGEFMKVQKAAGVIDPAMEIQSKSVIGLHKNEDLVFLEA